MVEEGLHRGGAGCGQDQGDVLARGGPDRGEDAGPLASLIQSSGAWRRPFQSRVLPCHRSVAASPGARLCAGAQGKTASLGPSAAPGGHRRRRVAGTAPGPLILLEISRGRGGWPPLPRRPPARRRHPERTGAAGTRPREGAGRAARGRPPSPERGAAAGPGSRRPGCGADPGPRPSHDRSPREAPRLGRGSGGAPPAPATWTHRPGDRPSARQPGAARGRARPRQDPSDLGLGPGPAREAVQPTPRRSAVPRHHRCEPAPARGPSVRSSRDGRPHRGRPGGLSPPVPARSPRASAWRGRSPGASPRSPPPRSRTAPRPRGRPRARAPRRRPH